MKRSLRALDWVNFCMADVQTGVGPFVAIYLTASRHWNPAQAGLAIAAQNIANLAAQVPAGALVDWSRCKKWLIAGAAAVVGAGAVAVVHAKTLAWMMGAQAMIGVAAALFPPAIAAIALGIVGKQRLPHRIGRNEAFNHSGNVMFALAAGLIGTYIGQRWIFYTAAMVAAITVVAALAIRNGDIDNEAARAASNHGVMRLREVFRDHRILVFTVSVVLFHLANAAMLPLAGERLARGRNSEASLLMSACIIIAQLVMTPVALATGRLADRLGRKPIFLTAFAVLAVRGMLFSIATGSVFLLSVQVLDGVGAGIFGVLWTLIVADIAQGTGRFNLLQGVIQGALNLGAFGSNAGAGLLARGMGFQTAFFALAAVAAAGFLFFAIFMPETKGSGSRAGIMVFSPGD